ncbi:MAG: F0F1 ATP synthase subunit B, partial [Planctomycetes bacterium]|nr:F0F1 ATP synthase subunit B [Planctomycetota bacterium]
VSFGLLFLVLSKFIFPMMFKALNSRKQHIEDALAKADRVNAEAEELLKKHEKMLAESHAEAKRITDEAISAGAKAREDLIASAKKDADNIVRHAKAEIRRSQDAAMEEIRNQAVELSLLASSQLLERSLTDDDHRRLATQAVDTAVSAFANKN